MPETPRSPPTLATNPSGQVHSTILDVGETGSMLTTLIRQQEGFKEQLTEICCMMRTASQRHEALKEQLFARIEGNATICKSSEQHSLTRADSPGPWDSVEVAGDDPAELSPSKLKVAPAELNLNADPIPEEQVEKNTSPMTLTPDAHAGHVLHITMSSEKDISTLALNGSGNLSRSRGQGWRSDAQTIVNSDKFEMLLALVIVANCIVFAFEVQYVGFQVGLESQYRGYTSRSEISWPGADTTFIIFDWIFGMCFLVEAALKIACFGCRYFAGGCNSLWNWLDLICVIAFFVDKIASSLLPVSPQMMRLLRLFRLMRLIRVFRTLEALDVLYTMVTAIKGMGKVLAWAVALLSVILMSEALFLTQVLHASYFSIAPTDWTRRQKMFEYFGTFTRCVLSMFEMTIANWPPVTRVLTEETSEWAVLFCLIHKLTIGFAVVGVINGVIIQETFKVAATDDVIMVKQKQKTGAVAKKKMKALFEALDSSRDGKVSYAEFQIIAADPEVKTWLASMDIETDDLQTLFKLIDYDGSGAVTLDELCSRMPRIKGGARSIDVLAMRHKFNEVYQVLNVHSETLKSVDERLTNDERTIILNAEQLPRLHHDRVSIGGSYNDIPQAKDWISI